jgi:hypothetical protein
MAQAGEQALVPQAAFEAHDVAKVNALGQESLRRFFIGFPSLFPWVTFAQKLTPCSFAVQQL